jgi:hypothetical protein
MQLDPDLTLEKTISLARQSEAVKKQQPLIRGQIEPEGSIHLDSSIFINESAGSSKSLKSLYVFLPSLGLRKIELLRV